MKQMYAPNANPNFTLLNINVMECSCSVDLLSALCSADITDIM